MAKYEKLKDETASHMSDQEIEIRRLHRFVEEVCQDEDDIRNLLRPYMDVDGNNYGVPTIVTLVENMVEKYKHDIGIRDFWFAIKEEEIKRLKGE